MATVLQSRPRANIVTHISHSADRLKRVKDADCNLAIWQRTPIEGLHNMLTARPRDIRFTAPIAQFSQALKERLSEHGFADHPSRGWLLGDAAMLADRFATIMGLPAVEMRLEMVKTNSCSKFHADYVRARLITTYIGIGTQWLDQQNAEASAQGRTPQTIHTMNAGDVGIFKGKLATDHPAIHRSPPIEGTGEARLLLVLNPPDQF